MNNVRKSKDNDNEQDKLIRDIQKGIDKINDEIDGCKTLKQELVELGIAKDDGMWNVIEVKPERFLDYLEYLEEHPDKRK